MDDKYLARFRERSAYESARTDPPEGFPKLRDLPLGRYTDPTFQDLEHEYLFKRVWLYAAPRLRAARPRQLQAVRHRRRSRAPRSGRGRRGAGLLQRLPPPGGSGRAGRVRDRPHADLPVPLLDATTSPASWCGCPTSGTSSSSDKSERGLPPGALRGLGRLALRQPRPRRRAAARLARSHPHPPARGRRRPVPGDRRQEGGARLQLEDPGRGLPRGVPRPHHPPEDDRPRPRHPGHGDHPLRPRPPVAWCRP